MVPEVVASAHETATSPIPPGPVLVHVIVARRRAERSKAARSGADQDVVAKGYIRTRRHT